MHLSTWLRIAEGAGALKPEDLQEVKKAAALVKQLLFARSIPPEAAAREMARFCGLMGAEVERWRKEQDEFAATIMVGFRRGAPDTVTLSDGTEHKVEHEKLGGIYRRLADHHGVKPRTIKDWVRKHLR